MQGYFHKIKETSGVKMSTDDVSALFGNIESIYDFNRYRIILYKHIIVLTSPFLLYDSRLYLRP